MHPVQVIDQSRENSISRAIRYGEDIQALNGYSCPTGHGAKYRRKGV